MTPPKSKINPGSFRDRNGFVFHKNKKVFRQINLSDKDNYDYLIKIGLYEHLRKKGYLISHKEVNKKHSISKDAYKVIQLEKIWFISYPYEWCFSQLKEAALLTLKIQRKALKYDMSLKDASAYNIQFKDYKPVFIDTQSFEKYKKGRPWVAYRQFCRHFLAPLALMAFKDIRFNKILRIYIDGIPLNLASKLLPFKTRFNFTLLSGIHLHARLQEYLGTKSVDKGKYKMSKRSLLTLINNLELNIKKMHLKSNTSQWSEYYSFTNYAKKSFYHKKEIVSKFLEKANPKTVWDFGANTGEFSRIASKKGMFVVSFEKDPIAVEKNYGEVLKKGEKNLLPIFMDLIEPSANIGWANEERMSLTDRGPTDTILALAIIHHLAISNNIPIGKIAKYCAKICQTLIIEFIPKEDSNVKRLLTSREDIFSDYNQVNFENEFTKHFTIIGKENIINSKRIMYFMRKSKE